MAANTTPCLHAHLTREANPEAHGKIYICACGQTFTVILGVEPIVVETHAEKSLDARPQD